MNPYGKQEESGGKQQQKQAESGNHRQNQQNHGESGNHQQKQQNHRLKQADSGNHHQKHRLKQEELDSKYREEIVCFVNCNSYVQHYWSVQKPLAVLP